MNIVVCIKQVPATQKVEVDPNTGVLIRDGIESKMNPYDLYALETAIKISEKVESKIHVLSMGPNSALEVIKEAFSLGAHEGWLLSDRKFAGADVLATAYTLAMGIKAIGDVDLILCGKQTTDGDTAQVGPEMAEVLGIPHISWVKELVEVNENNITLRQDMTDFDALVRVAFPCLITVEKGIFMPNLPSYKKAKASKDYPIHVLSHDDIKDIDDTRIGLSGSPTQVERVFNPTSDIKTVRISGDHAANELVEILKENKIIGV